MAECPQRLMVEQRLKRLGNLHVKFNDALVDLAFAVISAFYYEVANASARVRAFSISALGSMLIGVQPPHAD
jgi:predicted outer membrane lipoprotein